MSTEDDDSKMAEEQILKIQEACAELGWSIAMNDSNELIRGLIIGVPQYIKKTVDDLEDCEQYSVWEKPDANSNLH